MSMASEKSEKLFSASSLSWMAIWAAVIGATNFVPLLPWFGGGGYYALAYLFAGFAGMLFGLRLGVITAFIGGIIGWVIVPPSHPVGIMDVICNEVGAAVAYGLASRGNWKHFLPWVVTVFVIYFVVLPSNIVTQMTQGANILDPSLQTTWLRNGLWYYVGTAIWFILMPKFGKKWILDPTLRKRYFGTVIGLIGGVITWYLWWDGVWLQFYGAGLGLITLNMNLTPPVYPAIHIIFILIGAGIYVALRDGLMRAGLKPPAGAIPYGPAVTTTYGPPTATPVKP